MIPAKAFLIPYTRGSGLLLVDPATEAAKSDAQAKATAERVAKIYWPHWNVHANVSTFAPDALDFAVSPFWPLAADPALVWSRIKVGGCLALWVVDGIGAMSAMEDVGQRSGQGWDLVEDDPTPEGRLLVFRKRADGALRSIPWRRKHRNVLVIRLGAIGDQIMASSILPGLKADGWHVTWNAQPPTVDVMTGEPLIDQFWTQDPAQVPPEQLDDYHRALATRFDRVINLCESVEVMCLAMPGRVSYTHDDAARRAIFNQNYVEVTHKIAGVPFVPRPRFVPTDDENAIATALRAKIGRPIIYWAIAGSGPHKVWPHQARAIVRLLHETDAAIVLGGGPADKGASAALGDTAEAFCPPEFAKRRLIDGPASGLTMRQSLTLAVHADVVVGPETGALNAASHEPNAKVLILSHSTVQNLSRDWVNTVSLVGEKPPACYPCHRMHPTWEFCNRVELPTGSGGAACAHAVTTEQVVSAVKAALANARRDQFVVYGGREAA